MLYAIPFYKFLQHFLSYFSSTLLSVPVWHNTSSLNCQPTCRWFSCQTTEPAGVHKTIKGITQIYIVPPNNQLQGTITPAGFLQQWKCYHQGIVSRSNMVDIFITENMCWNINVGLLGCRCSLQQPLAAQKVSTRVGYHDAHEGYVSTKDVFEQQDIFEQQTVSFLKFIECWKVEKPHPQVIKTTSLCCHYHHCGQLSRAFMEFLSA